MYQDGYQGDLTLGMAVAAMVLGLALMPAVWAGILWIQDRRITVDVSGVPAAELDAWKARTESALASAKPSEWRILPPPDAIVADDLGELNSTTEDEQAEARVESAPWTEVPVGLAVKLEILSSRWGGEVTIERDDFTGAYVAWRDQVPLASGATPEEAVEAALGLERGGKTS